MNALYNLKQLKKSLREYIEEAREVQRILPKEIQNQISYKLISGLIDDMIKRIVRDITAQKEDAAYDFEVTVRLVKSITENQDKENQQPNCRERWNCQHPGQVEGNAAENLLPRNSLFSISTEL